MVRKPLARITIRENELVVVSCQELLSYVGAGVHQLGMTVDPRLLRSSGGDDSGGSASKRMICLAQKVSMLE